MKIMLSSPFDSFHPNKLHLSHVSCDTFLKQDLVIVKNPDKKEKEKEKEIINHFKQVLSVLCLYYLVPTFHL